MEKGQNERVFYQEKEKDKLSEILSTRQREGNDEIENQNWEAKQEREERVTRERQQQEKKFLEEKYI